MCRFSSLLFTSLLLFVSCCVILCRAELSVSVPNAIPSVHVFLVAGQSNSVGYNTDPVTAEDYTDPRILQLQCCNNSQKVPIDQCFLNISQIFLMPCDGGRISFANPFAHTLLSTLPDQDMIVLVPTGISGTGFFDNVWPAYTGSGFKAAISMMQQTWSLLKSYSSYNVTFSGILWHQGEHDAGDNGNGQIANTTYYLQYDIGPMIAAFRDPSLLSFTYPSLPFVAAQMLPSWVDNTTHPLRVGVKVALSLLTQYVPYTGYADSYGTLGDPVYRSGLDQEIIHFTARSQRILGKRYYAAYQAAQINYPETPPNIDRRQHREDNTNYNKRYIKQQRRSSSYNSEKIRDVSNGVIALGE